MLYKRIYLIYLYSYIYIYTVQCIYISYKYADNIYVHICLHTLSFWDIVPTCCLKRNIPQVSFHDFKVESRVQTFGKHDIMQWPGETLCHRWTRIGRMIRLSPGWTLKITKPAEFIHQTWNCCGAWGDFPPGRQDWSDGGGRRAEVCRAVRDCGMMFSF